MFWKYAANLQENTRVEVYWNRTSQSNLIEIALRHGCSPANLLHIFRTPFPKNISRGLLLSVVTTYFYLSNLLRKVWNLKDLKRKRFMLTENVFNNIIVLVIIFFCQRWCYFSKSKIYSNFSICLKSSNLCVNRIWNLDLRFAESAYLYLHLFISTSKTDQV